MFGKEGTHCLEYNERCSASRMMMIKLFLFVCADMKEVPGLVQDTDQRRM